MQRSPSETSSAITSSFLSTLVDSPVKELSLTCKEKLSKTLPSAATISPASSKRISPGTISFDATSLRIPSRSTFAFGADNSFRESKDFSAFTYCTVPRMAFKIITTKITTVLSTFPETIEITAAAIKIRTNRSLNCSKNIIATLFFPCSVSTFSPCLRSSFAACSSVWPSAPP